MGSVSYDIHASSYCYKSHIQALFMVMALESLYSRTESPLQSIMILKRLNFDISAKVGVYITKKQSHDFLVILRANKTSKDIDFWNLLKSSK